MNSHELSQKVVEQLKSLGSVDVVNNDLTRDSSVEHVVDVDMIVDETVFNVSITVIYFQPVTK